MKITLNEAEVRLAKFLGKHRRKNGEKGILDRQIGKQDKLFIDVNGMGGEIAVARYLNVYPDTSISPRSGGHDLVFRDRRVDVKTTEYMGGRLLAAKHKDHCAAEIYVLVIGSLPTYTIVGWTTAAQLLRESMLKDLGHGQGYAMDRGDLFPMWSIYSIKPGDETAAA